MYSSVQQMADRVAELMELRLRIRGEDLGEKVRRGRRMLPRKVSAAASYLADTAEQARVPKLVSQIDSERTAEAYDTCVRYLKPLGAGARRKALMWQVLGGAAVAVFATLVGLLAVLFWRGYV